LHQYDLHKQPDGERDNFFHVISQRGVSGVFYVDSLGLDEHRLRTLSEIGTHRRALWGELLDLLQINHEKHGDERIRRSMTRIARNPAENTGIQYGRLPASQHNWGNSLEDLPQM
jgi:hypothetical protein